MKNRIRPIRMEKGLRGDQLAEKINIEWKELFEIEQGKKDPSVKVMKKIVQTLEEPVYVLFPEFEIKCQGKLHIFSISYHQAW